MVHPEKLRNDTRGYRTRFRSDKTSGSENRPMRASTKCAGSTRRARHSPMQVPACKRARATAGLATARNLSMMPELIANKRSLLKRVNKSSGHARNSAEPIASVSQEKQRIGPAEFKFHLHRLSTERQRIRARGRQPRYQPLLINHRRSSLLCPLTSFSAQRIG